MEGIDVLADVLAAARIGGTLICHRRMTPPWGLRFRQEDLAGFHLITRGSFWLRMDHGATVQLAQGDLVFLPHGSGHDLLDDLRTQPVLFEDLEQLRGLNQPECPLEASGGAPAGFICGAYAFDAEGAHPVLSLLPPMIHIPAEQVEASRSLQRTLELLRQGGGGPG